MCSTSEMSTSTRFHFNVGIPSCSHQYFWGRGLKSLGSVTIGLVMMHYAVNQIYI